MPKLDKIILWLKNIQIICKSWIILSYIYHQKLVIFAILNKRYKRNYTGITDRGGVQSLIQNPVKQLRWSDLRNSKRHSVVLSLQNGSEYVYEGALSIMPIRIF